MADPPNPAHNMRPNDPPIVGPKGMDPIVQPKVAPPQVAPAHTQHGGMGSGSGGMSGGQRGGAPAWSGPTHDKVSDRMRGTMEAIERAHRQAEANRQEMDRRAKNDLQGHSMTPPPVMSNDVKIHTGPRSQADIERGVRDAIARQAQIELKALEQEEQDLMAKLAKVRMLKERNQQRLGAQ